MESLSPIIPEPVFLEHKGSKPIVYRPAGLDGSKIPVLMLHGLESHSGWFVQSAAHIAGLGHPVYAMDRSGSGMSQAARGTCTDFKDMLADIKTLADELMSIHQTSHFHLLGHCFGAIPATAFACEQPSMLASLVLATPAIYTRAEPSISEKIKILWSALTGHDVQIPVPLKASWFTDQDKYINFIEHDKLALKSASANLYWQTMRARKYIHSNGQKLTMAVMTAMAGKDRICDNQKNQHFFDRLPARKKERYMYPDAVHILEYSSEKEAFFADLSAWLSRLESDIMEQ